MPAGGAGAPSVSSVTGVTSGADSGAAVAEEGSVAGARVLAGTGANVSAVATVGAGTGAGAAVAAGDTRSVSGHWQSFSKIMRK